MSHAAETSLKILIIDDELPNRELLDRALSRDGHRCVQAASGEEALDLYAAETPDLVFMDVMLPGIDGFEATRRLRRLPTEKWTPIIFVSALGTPVDIVTGLDAGGDDYLTKPIDLAVLRSKIEASRRLAALHNQLESKTRQLQRYFEESEAERHVAAKLLRDLRREDKPAVPGVEVRTIPAAATNDFNGDIVAIEETPDGRLHLMLADAAGHGLVAAVHVLPAVDIFRRMSTQGHDMPSIIARVNDGLRELSPSGRFISALFACLDATLATIEVWNAGIPGAFLIDTEGRVLRRFDSSMPPLGIQRVDSAESGAETMAPGQMLVAVSDGLVEALNAAGVEFGMEGLIAALSATAARGCDAVLESLRAHVGGQKFEDDISICVVRQSPAPRLVGRFGHLAALAECPPGRVGFSMTYGPEQFHHLRMGYITPRFMTAARAHFDLSPSCYSRLFRVIRQLVANAVDWGLLRLPPAFASQSPGARCRQRVTALAALDAGELLISLHQSINGENQRFWDVVVEDSGPGFDGAAALERAVAARPRPGGLALVADDAHGISFEARGNRVRVSVPE